MLIRRRTLLAASAATAIASPAIAQNYPRRAVQLIVAFPAGGSTDVGARILAGLAEKDFGQPITVVNKGGAGGQIGFTEIARAKPDGYTLGFLNLPGMNTITLDPERKAVFTIDSFIPIVNQVLDPGFIWVKGDSPYKTLADLVDAAKKNPGKISACTTGILSDDHLAILMLQEAAKCEFRLVHFDGGAQQLTGVLGGHVDVAFDNVGSVFKRVAHRRDPRAGRHRHRALEVPAADPHHQGTGLCNGDLQLDARRRRAQGHAGRHLQGRRDRLPEGDQLARDEGEDGRRRPGAEADGRRGIRQVLRRPAGAGEEVHGVGAENEVRRLHTLRVRADSA